MRPGALPELRTGTDWRAVPVSSGHYYAYARDAHDNWSSYNDSYVTSVSLQTVLRATPGAYILFYQRMHPPLPFALPSAAAPLPPPPAASLKRKRALLPAALTAAKAHMLTAPDGPVAALEARLRASALVPMLRDSLRLVRSRLPADATAEELVCACRAEGHFTRARLMIGEHAAPEAQGIIRCTIREVHAQLARATAALT